MAQTFTIIVSLVPTVISVLKSFQQINEINNLLTQKDTINKTINTVATEANAAAIAGNTVITEGNTIAKEKNIVVTKALIITSSLLAIELIGLAAAY